jgi:ribose 5-phosphate isomerase B
LIISIGSDHGGFELKQELVKNLKDTGHKVYDRGCVSPEPVDYPDIAKLVTSDIISGKAQAGILVCGTGIGMCNAASRIDGIIAALCTNSYMARMARLHNDANILCLGGRVVGTELAFDIVGNFLSAEPLLEEKYLRRRGKVDDLE